MRREVRKDSQRNDPSTRRAGIFPVLQIEPQITQMLADDRRLRLGRPTEPCPWSAQARPYLSCRGPICVGATRASPSW